MTAPGELNQGHNGFEDSWGQRADHLYPEAKDSKPKSLNAGETRRFWCLVLRECPFSCSC